MSYVRLVWTARPTDAPQLRAANYDGECAICTSPAREIAALDSA